MKVLFVNYSPLGPNFNSSISALAAFLLSHGKNVDIVSFRIETPLTDVIRMILTINPDIVCFSVFSQHWDYISHLINFTRKSFDGTIVCGGHHPTLCPDEVISKDGIDIICIGEGERPLLSLVNAMENGHSILNIEGLWIKTKTHSGFVVMKNKIPSPIDLDCLPFLERKIFMQNNLERAEYSPSFLGNIPILSGRGCPFECSFCSNSSWKKIYNRMDGLGFVRKRSVENVIDECASLVARFNVNFFEFWDEEFANNKKWLRHFCKRYKNDINKPFGCALRAESANISSMEILFDAGCRSVAFGVEVGNEKYRIKHLNRRMTNDMIVNVFRTSKEIGFKRYAFVMIGLPYETPKMIDETILLLKKILPDEVNWGVFQPIPKTSLFDLCKEQSFFGSVDLTPYEVFPAYKVKPLNQPSLLPHQLLEGIQKIKSLRKLGIKINW